MAQSSFYGENPNPEAIRESEQLLADANAALQQVLTNATQAGQASLDAQQAATNAAASQASADTSKQAAAASVTNSATNAASTAADRSTVAADKATVAGYKDAAATSASAASTSAQAASNSATAASNSATAAAASATLAATFDPALYAKLAGANAFTARPTFNGATPWDSGNLANPAKTDAANNFTADQTLKATTAGSRLLNIDALAGNARRIACLSSGSMRWQFGADATAESGGGSGSAFIIQRFNDAGALVDAPLTISRSSAVATFSARPVFGTATPWDSLNFTPGNYALLASPAFTGTATFAARPTFNGATPWDSLNYTPSPVAQCRLSFLSATQIQLVRWNGNQITINGSRQTIPQAGVTYTQSGLTTGTVYFVYAFMNAGTMTLELSVTTFATDTTTGNIIKSGDATRTLVGKVLTSVTAGSPFYESTAHSGVLSYWNRIPKKYTVTNGVNISSAAASAIWQMYMFCWNDQKAVEVHTAGYVSTSVSQTNYMQQNFASVNGQLKGAWSGDTSGGLRAVDVMDVFTTLPADNSTQANWLFTLFGWGSTASLCNFTFTGSATIWG